VSRNWPPADASSRKGGRVSHLLWDWFAKCAKPPRALAQGFGGAVRARRAIGARAPRLLGGTHARRPLEAQNAHFFPKLRVPAARRFRSRPPNPRAFSVGPLQNVQNPADALLAGTDGKSAPFFPKLRVPPHVDSGRGRQTCASPLWGRCKMCKIPGRSTPRHRQRDALPSAGGGGRSSHEPLLRAGRCRLALDNFDQLLRENGAYPFGKSGNSSPAAFAGSIINSHRAMRAVREIAHSFPKESLSANLNSCIYSMGSLQNVQNSLVVPRPRHRQRDALQAPLPASTERCAPGSAPSTDGAVRSTQSAARRRFRNTRHVLFIRVRM
jgi:hypothetical protein